MWMKSKKISNDQELIQSDPTSCPQNQKGKHYSQWHALALVTKDLDSQKFGPCLFSADRDVKTRPYISKSKEKFNI